MLTPQKQSGLVILFFLSLAWRVAAQTPAPAFGPARWYPETVLIQNGQPAAVVVASSSDSNAAAAAGQVARALQTKYGVSFAVVADTNVCPDRLGPVATNYQAVNLIVAGNLDNNRVIFPLYAMSLCGSDSVYPGSGGYEIRTVSNPWGTGRNVLIVGSSVATNMQAAVAAFASRLPAAAGGGAALPYTIAIKPGPNQQALFISMSNSPASWPTADTNSAYYGTEKFTVPAEYYYWTGDERWAAIARDYINVFNLHFSNIYWGVGHYTMEGPYRAWDMVEESPAFTDDERQTTARHFLETALHERDSIHSGPVPIGIGSTHSTLPVIARWVASRYLRRTFTQNTNMAALCDTWENGVTNYYHGAAAGIRDDDEAQGSSPSSIAVYMRWAAMAQRCEYFDSGNARAGVQYALTMNDSLGYDAGIDTYGGARIGSIYSGYNTSPLFHLQMAAYVYQDAGMTWLIRNIANRTLALYGQEDFPFQAGAFTRGTPEETRRPDYLCGFSVIPLDGRKYQVMGKFARKAIPAQSQCFDKACFRGGFNTNDPYLLLQGLNIFNDANTIPRYTDKGKVWLIHNTSQIGHYYRNALFISNGRNEAPLPAACRLDAAARFQDYTMSASTLSDYYGTDWQRTIFWRTGSWFMVMDRATVKSNGLYSAQSVWRLPMGAAWISGRMLQAAQDDKRFYLVSSVPVDATARFERPAGGPPDVCENPFFLRERQSGSLKTGDVLEFQNLLVTTESNAPCAWLPIRINDSAVLVRSQSGDDVFMGVGGPGCAACGIAADQGLYVADGKAIYIAGVKRLIVEGATLLDADKPVTGRIDLQTGQLTSGYDADQLKAAALTWQLPQNASRSLVNANIARKAGECIAAAMKTVKDNSTAVAQKQAARDSRSLFALAWENTDLGFEGQRVSGLRVACKGDWNGRESALYDGIVLNGAGHVGWPQNGTGQVEVTWSPNQPIYEVRLHMAPIYHANSWELSFDVARSMTNEMLPVEITWSSDGFKNDLRTETRSIRREYRVDPTYKCNSTPQSYLRIVTTNGVAASGVRLSIPPSVTVRRYPCLSEVEVFSTNRGPVPIRLLKAVDLNNDGQNEWVVNAGEGVLLVLNAAGRMQWRQTFVAEISGVDFGDINGDGRQEILVSDYDQCAYAFAPDGTLLWQTDFVNLFERSGHRFSGPIYGITPYGIGFWDLGNGVKRVLVGTYEQPLFVLDTKGNIIQQYYPGFSMFQRLFVPGTADLNGDGRMEKIMCSHKYGASGDIHVLIGSPDGVITGHCNTYIPDNLPYAAELSGTNLDVITPVGAGVYNLAKNIYTCQDNTDQVWEHIGRPISAGLVADINGDGNKELVTAGDDGFVCVYTEGGALQNSILLGMKINDLATLGQGTNTVLVLATSEGLRVYDQAWRLLGVQPGCYVKIQSAPDRQSVLAVTDDARIQLWNLHKAGGWRLFRK